MRRAVEIRHVEQRIPVCRFDVIDVERRAGDAAILQPFLQRVFVDHAAARAVDQHCAGLHLVECRGAIEADGGRVAR